MKPIDILIAIVTLALGVLVNLGGIDEATKQSIIGGIVAAGGLSIAAIRVAIKSAGAKSIALAIVIFLDGILRVFQINIGPLTQWLDFLLPFLGGGAALTLRHAVAKTGGTPAVAPTPAKK